MLLCHGCHSLVSANQDDDEDSAAVDDKVTGDPIEVAALEGIEWTWNAKSSTATPVSTKRMRPMAQWKDYSLKIR